MDKGDQVWWINGAGDRLTGTVRESAAGGRTEVWCHERQALLWPRNFKLRTGEAGDQDQSPETSD